MSGKRPVDKPKPKNLTLRVPNVFKKGDSVLLMSASHRGDMYHFRAALQIENFSVILYDSNHTDDTKPKTKDLEDYLAESVLRRGKHIFIVPWKYGALHGDEPPDPTKPCFLDGKLYVEKEHSLAKVQLGTFSERASTQIIASAPDALKDVITGMTILSKTMVGNKFPDFEQLLEEFPTVSDDFERLWTQWKDAGVKAGENAILLMYRDTGTRDPAPVVTMGVYPELDNGKATDDITKLVADIAKKENKPLTIFTCGFKDSDIGEYWNDLRNIKPKEPKISTRDFEAYFLKWSYEKKHFRMATGFRSGALDLFTFMGIPTVSIGLRNLMGEGRHQMLAHEKFQRVNIQYDSPRHKVTAAVKSDRQDNSSKPDQTTFGSPFWIDGFQHPENATKRAIPEDTKGEQMQKAGNFAPFDKTVVDIGYRFALEKHMSLGQTIRTLKASPETKRNELPRTITTSEARFCYPHKLSGQREALKKYFDDQEKLDYQAVTAMKEASAELQQSPAMIKKYEKDYDDNWDEMIILIKKSKSIAPLEKKRGPRFDNTKK
ncbi:hypothetical protein TGAMA5MH_02431 [Trichoderma gamsii]|uniref:Uncharacterized protein n=1 Tax=Trichoderma gamsii TaxID=398673 RepID=A0A2K0TLJ9_9HYPO|nr:hypothetical protein TGAMA5MH_02431 [Trichoderma gamsii]